MSKVSFTTYERYRSHLDGRFLLEGSYRIPTSFINEVRVQKGISNVEQLKLIGSPSGDQGPVSSTERLYIRNNGGDATYNLALIKGAVASQLAANVDSCLRSFNDDQSDFELIPFLADWDSTMAMFTKKYLRDLSHGAVEWGIAPFIRDCFALISSLRSLISKFPGSTCSTVTRQRPLIYSRPYSSILEESDEVGVVTSVDGSTRVHGYVVKWAPKLDSLLDKLAFLLDKLGVHPDLSTAWDIVPLSFLVDYFLPIGDLLESLHPRGWQDPSSHFTGFITHKMFAQTAGYRNRSGFRFVELPCTWKYYSRTYVINYPIRISKTPAFSTPSLKELFNTAYLTTAMKNYSYKRVLFDKVPFKL
jgi:hypothetical protein